MARASLSTAKKSAQQRAGAKLTTPSNRSTSSWGKNGGEALGVNRPGATLVQTGANGQPVKPAGTPIPHPAAPAAPAAPPDNAIQPFLTDAQKAGLSAWNTKYANDIAQLGENDTLAQDTYTQNLAADTLKNAQETDMANQAMAARGLFQSSIRDNALNDLNVTLAQQRIALGSARDAAIFTDQNQRGTLGAQNTAEQMTYNTDAIANAQAITPTVPPAGQAGAPTGGAHAPAQPPTPTGPPKPQGVTRIGPPGASFKQTGAMTGMSGFRQTGAATGPPTPKPPAGLRVRI